MFQEFHCCNFHSSFVVNWLCGCVVSEKAINEVKSTVCVCCGGPFSSDDLIVLNPESELLQKYEAKLEEERQKRRELRAKKSNCLDLTFFQLTYKVAFNVALVALVLKGKRVMIIIRSHWRKRLLSLRLLKGKTKHLIPLPSKMIKMHLLRINLYLLLVRKRRRGRKLIG